MVDRSVQRQQTSACDDARRTNYVDAERAFLVSVARLRPSRGCVLRSNRHISGGILLRTSCGVIFIAIVTILIVEGAVSESCPRTIAQIPSQPLTIEGFAKRRFAAGIARWQTKRRTGVARWKRRTVTWRTCLLAPTDSRPAASTLLLPRGGGTREIMAPWKSIWHRLRKAADLRSVVDVMAVERADGSVQSTSQSLEEVKGEIPRATGDPSGWSEESTGEAHLQLQHVPSESKALWGSANISTLTRYDENLDAPESTSIEQVPSASDGPSLLSSIGRLISSLMENPEQTLRIVASTTQIGIVVYLGFAIWKAAKEVIQEYTQELNGTSLDGSSALGGGGVAGDASLSFAGKQGIGGHDDIARVVSFLERQTALNQDGGDKSQERSAFQKSREDEAAALPNLQLLQLAQQLVRAGLPLRQTAIVAEDQDSHTIQEQAPPSSPSVEEILRQLTRSEGILLQQCLWTPSRGPGDEFSDRYLWDSIAGLDEVKGQLLSSISLVRLDENDALHNAFAPLFEKSHQAGVFLYGPPGCGKTLIVKSLAHMVNLPCLVVTPSLLLRKYVGETNLQVRSLFSLASKLAPCILCIDELDGLFRERNENEHEVSRDLKTEFLQWWDGMMSDRPEGDVQLDTGPGPSTQARRVFVVGATNRPFDVDSAVLRRLPSSHFIGLPGRNARYELLRLMLRGVPTEENFDFHFLAERTHLYSPSDIRQLLQTAALNGPLRTARGKGLKWSLNDTKGMSTPAVAPLEQHPVVPLRTIDVVQAMSSSQPTRLSAQYRAALEAFAKGRSEGSMGASRARKSDFVFTDDGDTPQSDGPESNWGNFYDLGTLEIDRDTWNDLHSFLFENDDDDPDDDEKSDDSDPQSSFTKFTFETGTDGFPGDSGSTKAGDFEAPSSDGSSDP
jgi:ATPase family AAA domain-containing protein 1